MTPLTIPTVAKSCGVSRSLVLQWVHTKYIKAHRSRPGAVWRVELEELERFKREEGYPKVQRNDSPS